MVQIIGVKAVQAKLKGFQEKNKENPTVIVGYTQSYALKVHEDMEARHKQGKQAKYLESPAREFQMEIAQIIESVYKQTKSMNKAVLAGGLFLQRKSQEIVPIDTSALKNSAFTALQENADEAAQKAHARSEGFRNK